MIDLIWCYKTSITRNKSLVRSQFLQTIYCRSENCILNPITISMCTSSHSERPTFLLLYWLFFPSLLASVSKVHRIYCGTRLPPANQVLGLSTLARVEALGPGGCWGLGRRGGGWGGGLFSWWAVAWVSGTDGGRRIIRVTHAGTAPQITKTWSKI